ncbi:PREDICTED: uncharacterized protein LOC103326950 [Prunus mume]|uniref:Uncharacterized protein LOC103326950 n=1 Tax=Prunus mume TaxID=102107 RepID=A0ABM0NNI0_PRUMU|nr:PREDICTED: uncharacterized protein LOC103326950 [Prunus mume]
MIMDQSNDEDQKLVAVPKKYSNKYLFYLGQLLMKRTLKLLLSVSLLSLFLLCYSSSSVSVAAPPLLIIMNPTMSLWIRTPSLMLLVKMKGNRQLYKKEKKTTTTEMDNRKNLKMGLYCGQKKYLKLLAQKKKEEVNL